MAMVYSRTLEMNVGKRSPYCRVPNSPAYAVLIGPRADGLHLRQQLRHLHARQRLEQRGHLRGDRGEVAGDLVRAGWSPSPVDTIVILSMFASGAASA
jgi:hypothetical protein